MIEWLKYGCLYPRLLDSRTVYGWRFSNFRKGLVEFTEEASFGTKSTQQVMLCTLMKVSARLRKPKNLVFTRPMVSN